MQIYIFLQVLSICFLNILREVTTQRVALCLNPARSGQRFDPHDERTTPPGAGRFLPFGVIGCFVSDISSLQQRVHFLEEWVHFSPIYFYKKQHNLNIR